MVYSVICSYVLYLIYSYYYIFILLDIISSGRASIDGIILHEVMANPRSMVMLYFIIPVPAALFGGLFVAYDAYLAYQGVHGAVGKLNYISLPLLHSYYY